ncbi:hydrocephalus-inducing protein [Anoplophora glabripennis]|nr:hydrocephalus-inducing protein [Anoplophora glabripennis]
MPTVKDYLSGKLNIHVEGNPMKSTVHMEGYGIGSNLVFNNTELKFGSALPYTKDNVVMFIVQNISSAPVEFCFADYNQQYAQEKLWINAYFVSHCVKGVLVPERNVGGKLHNTFEDNYFTQVNELRKKLLKIDQGDADESETKEELSEDSVDPLTKYSPSEILRMLNEFVETTQAVGDWGSTDVQDNNDNFHSKMTIVEPKTNKPLISKKLQSGIFVIFHGGPNTEYFKAANWAGIKLKIPVYSIDRLIYESLVENSVIWANEINNLIDEEFEYVATKEDLVPVPEEDEYDTLMRKVYVILNTKKKTKTKISRDKVADKTNRISEKSSAKQTGKKDKDTNTLGDIPVELFEDLIKYKCKSFTNGVIIESLHSDFLRKISVALNSLLCAIGNSKYVHIILLSYTLQNYIKDKVADIAEKERTMGELKAAEREKNIKAKLQNKSSPEISESGKSSKKSKKPKKEKSDNEKSPLKDLQKDEKDAFDSFQALLADTFDLCQYWDRRSSSRIKATRSILKADVDPKDDVKESKGTQQKKKISCEETCDEIGFFLWVINHANKEKPINFSENIFKALNDFPNFQEAKKDLAEGFDEAKDSVLFTIITKSDNIHMTKSDFFSISTNDQITDKKGNEGYPHISSVSLLSTRAAISSKKKAAKHHKAIEEKPSIQAKVTENEVAPFELMSRRILQPEEVAYYTFTFCPKTCGKYNHNFTIQVTGLNSDIIINCSGVCELPTIDFNPHVMFPTVVESYRDKAANSNFVYIKDMNVLDFGLVFYDTDKPHKYEYQILLRNISQLPCDVKASLEEKSSYILQSNLLHIDPGQEVYLPISVKAAKSSILKSELCISVKNNPSSQIVNLVTKPWKLDFHIKPKALTFDKVPVACSLKKKIMLCNLSPVNLLWRFADFNWALQIFDISKTEGFLGPFSVFDVTFSYTPLREESHSKKQLAVQVFDLNYSDQVPLFVDYFTVHADSFDCVVEYSDHIDLEEIKGGKEHRVSFTLMNKGQHNTCITFSKIDNPLDKYKQIRKCFEVMNTNETLVPNKLFTGTLIFNPSKPMEFKEVPIFVCNVVECTHSENIMNSIIMKVSAKVFFSSFEISPAADINFGHQQIFSIKTHTVELKNTGKFPFSYTITYIKPEEISTDKSIKKSKSGINAAEKGSKKGSSKKSKENKDDKKLLKKKTKFNVGCFSIHPSEGDIMPNEIAQIEVECTPEKNEEYKEVITLFVSECVDEDINGRQITLNVIGCEPKLNFHNFKRIFREHFIVDKMENVNVPKIVTSHCIYEASEQTLHFRKVNLNTKAVSNIYMQNKGHVIAYVTAKIDDGNKNVFKVFPNSIDVDPFSTKSLSIIFKPDCVGETSCRLEITYNCSTNNKFSLALIGEGVMPKLMIIEPNLEQNNKSTINFLPTYIGHSRSQRISIKNIGSISAKAILQINNNINEALTLIACEDTYSMLNICDLEEFENTKYSTLVNLQPEEIANFILNYEPKCEESLDAVVKIHTVNNPFEIAQIAVSGQSYYHDICLEGLTPCIIKERNTMGYKIDFGFVFLHYIQRKMFTIKNYSEQYIYKFEFTDFGPLVFTPRVGHLKPLAHKEVIVSFCTRKPQYYDKDLVEFTVNKIEYITPASDILSWDERLKFVTWDIPKIEFSDKSTKRFSKTSYDEENEEFLEVERMSIKNTVDRPEPDFKIISETSEIIPCLFSVIADYATYINKICDITFPDTYINEKRKTQFEVENDGIVPLEIEWDFFYSRTETTRAVEKKNKTVEIKKDLARPISANSFISTNSSCSYEEEEAMPFAITPQKTSIYPNEAQEFTIEFRPLKYMDHNMILQSTIIGLKPKLKNIQINVTGKSLLPIYYFELEETNYLSRRPDVIKKCNSIDYADPKVIEFESVGIGVLSLRKLNIVNPGNESFTYIFDSLEQYPIFSYFECKTGSGLVKEGKKSEVIFTFKSHEFGNFEGYYMFKILEEEINVPFLLAARCRQPVVYFTQSYISIKPTILSVPSSATVKLLNNEDMELFYKFHNESLLNENQDQQLGISPKKGKLQPHSEQIIEVTFEAEKSGDVNFSVLCTVEKLPTPLTLNIFAQCEEVFSLISYWDKFNAIMNTLDKDNENIINLGMITPKKRETIKFSVCNKGKTGFFYTVQFNAKPVEHMFYIDVNQKKEFVASNKTSTLIIYLEALRKATLKDFKVKINISYGPTYLLNMNAKAETPLVKLSFHTHNFGYCIVQKTKTTYYSVTLELKNIGTRILMLENFYENNEDLTIDFKSGHVQPSATQYITMYFHPMNVGRYEINIPLKVNSVKYVVKIMGEAVDINLQLVKSSDKYIDLGGVLVGTHQHYVVQVINRTPTHVNVFFDLWQKLPFHTRPREKIYSEIKLPDVPEPTNQLASKSVKTIIKKKQIEENKKASSKESKKEGKKEKKVVEDVANKISKSQKPDKDKGKDKKKKEDEEVVQDDILELIEPPKKTAIDFLKISPRDCIQLGPDKKFQFTIDFMPTERIEHFSEKIFYEIQDHIEPLCVVKGFCLIPKFVLSQSQLKFSNVVIGLKHTMKTLLRNMGDFKGRFQWTLDKKIDVFSITPLSGFVGPSSEIEICVTFASKTVDSIYKTKAKCLIGGLEKPLELILEGNSTKVPTPISTLHFRCPVREKIQQQIKIFNKTKERWVIHPFISSEQFSTERDLIVEPDTEYTLDVTYKPEVMTTLAPHNATLFLPLPEGKAIIYTLIGQTLPPLPINKIKMDIKCKMYHTQVLSIRNWMNTKQCFNVTTELMTPLTTKCLYKVSGNPLVELFPNESKDYIWKIFIINEIPLDFKVIFTNIETNEYMYYEIYINVLPCDALETKVVTTCVRKPVDFMITLENPIDYPVTFTVECDLAESIFDQYVTLEPCSRYQLPFAYCPLKSDEITTYLYATCPELGTFTYCVKLIAKPPMPENTVKFKAELGEKVNKSVLWNNTFKAAVEFTAKFDHPVFSLEKVSSIPEGESGRLKFGFEPNQLGTIQSKAIVFSPQTGNYVYPLIGECVLPTPKGPFSVKPGGSTQISFVNPFMEDQTFNYYIDSNAFYLKTITETLKAKKSTKIIVNMQALKYLDVNVQPRQITAKLHVEVAGSPMNNIKWVFYIQSEI